MTLNNGNRGPYLFAFCTFLLFQPIINPNKNLNKPIKVATRFFLLFGRRVRHIAVHETHRGVGLNVCGTTRLPFFLLHTGSVTNKTV